MSIGLILRVLTLAGPLLALAAEGYAQELVFSPNLGDLAPAEAGKSSNPEHWSRLPPSYLGSGFEVGRFKNVQRPPANGEVTGEQFRLGSNYIELQTRKSMQPLEVLRRSGCQTDEECAEYWMLPKPELPKGLVKGFRPFIGFSVTRPLQ